MILHSIEKGRTPVNTERLSTLGELVWPGGGGKEIARLAEMVKAGEAISLDTLRRLG